MTVFQAFYGYLDPGSGSMILQVIAGGAAAVAVMGKVYWQSLRMVFHVKRDEAEQS